jgi:hypothetical protein
MEQQKTKKQHFVPCVYLRPFSPDGSQLFVFNKQQQKIFSSPIEDVAQQRYFYDVPQEALPEGVTDEQFIEKQLSRIEAKLPATIDLALKIECGEKLPDEARDAIALLIALQALRTSKARIGMVETIKQSVPDFVDSWASVLQGQVLFGSVLTDYALHLKENTIFMLGMNSTSVPLYTSDNPVVVHRTAMMGTTVVAYLALPLSPNRVLLVRRKHPHEMAYDFTPYPLEPAEVSTLNRLQMEDSHRQTFSPVNNFQVEPKESRTI